MATPVPRRAASFTILLPLTDTLALADPTNHILVRVKDQQGNTGYFATMTDLTTGRDVSSGPLVQERPGGQLWSLCMPVVTLSNNTRFVQSNNKVTVKVTQGAVGDSDANEFEAAFGTGSCSGSGTLPGSIQAAAGGGLAALRRAFFRTDQPLPVSLLLHLDDPAAGGGRRPTLMHYSGDPKFPCHWFGQAAGGAGPDRPAVWTLFKSDARTWVLLLRRGGDDVVTYRLT